MLVLWVLSFGVLCSSADQMQLAPMEKTEKVALYSAIQGFVGAWWNGSDLYPDPCGWTPIQGVACDLFGDTWYVTSLNIGPLQDNSLICDANGSFRQQLFELKHLRTLSFINCFVSAGSHLATIPTQSWVNLASSLVALEFRSNPGLIGQIPTRLGDLWQLQSLVLLENGLTGEIPATIGMLNGLRRLVLSGNQFSGQIPDTFGGLDQLLILDLSSNSLSGPLPLALGGLKSLLKLDLSNNKLSGRLPKEIGRLKNLTLLDIRNNNLSGGLVESIQEMGSLEEIVLSNNGFLGGNLMGLEWPMLRKLAILDLSKTGLSGVIPESVADLKTLRFLGLNDNNLTGNVPPRLADLPCVGAMYLNGNNLTGELKFSDKFYGKMGRRFGSWDNPNLCVPVDLVSSPNFPSGVNSCGNVGI